MFHIRANRFLRGERAQEFSAGEGNRREAVWEMSVSPGRRKGETMWEKPRGYRIENKDLS
jgi:hypothetical protein